MPVAEHLSAVAANVSDAGIAVVHEFDVGLSPPALSPGVRASINLPANVGAPLLSNADFHYDVGRGDPIAAQRQIPLQNHMRRLDVAPIGSTDQLLGSVFGRQAGLQ